MKKLVFVFIFALISVVSLSIPVLASEQVNALASDESHVKKLQKSTNNNQSNNTSKQLRIIALAPHIVEMLFELGVGENIVGTVEYADYPEQANKIPRVGGYYGMQIETILALEPDVIFAWKSGNKIDELSQLTRLGMNVIYSNPNNIADVATELRYFAKKIDELQQPLNGHRGDKKPHSVSEYNHVGINAEISTETNTETNAEIKIAGIVARANVIASNFEQRLANIRATYQHADFIDVFYQLWPEPMRTINKNTWIHQVIDICRGRNVFADNATAYPQISLENVMVAQPHIIILPDEKSETPQPKIQWQKWPEIPAVTANAFIRVNADLLHRFSPRMLNGVEQLCKDMEAYR